MEYVRGGARPSAPTSLCFRARACCWTLRCSLWLLQLSTLFFWRLLFWFWGTMEGDKTRGKDRLEALKRLQATTCFCSECGKRLRYSSFKSHPCFLLAVQRHGRYRARQLVFRVETPPRTPGKVFICSVPTASPVSPKALTFPLFHLLSWIFVFKIYLFIYLFINSYCESARGDGAAFACTAKAPKESCLGRRVALQEEENRGPRRGPSGGVPRFRKCPWPCCHDRWLGNSGAHAVCAQRRRGPPSGPGGRHAPRVGRFQCAMSLYSIPLCFFSFYFFSIVICRLVVVHTFIICVPLR